MWKISRRCRCSGRIFDFPSGIYTGRGCAMPVWTSETRSWVEARGHSFQSSLNMFYFCLQNYAHVTTRHTRKSAGQPAIASHSQVEGLVLSAFLLPVDPCDCLNVVTKYFYQFSKRLSAIFWDPTDVAALSTFARPRTRPLSVRIWHSDDAFSVPFLTLRVCDTPASLLSITTRIWTR